MGGGEDRVELPLADKVDCLGAGETGAGGEIMRGAIAILGRYAGENAVRQAVVDEVGRSGLVADDQVVRGRKRLARGVQDRAQLGVGSPGLAPTRAARHEQAVDHHMELYGREWA